MKHVMMGLAASTLLAISACGGGKDAPAPDPDAPVKIEASAADPATTKPEAPVETQLPAFELPEQLEREEDTYIASAQFPEGLGIKAPKLAERLKIEAETDFDDMASHAKMSKAENPEFFRPMEVDIVWSETAEAGPLLSLSSIEYVDGGGAHPNHFLSGVIHDKAANTDVKAADLFKDAGAAEALLAGLVHEELAREKAIRFQAGPEQTKNLFAEVGDQMPEDGVLSGEIALIGSSAAGKIGGMTFLYQPYTMGAYAEGSYIVTVPQRAFADLLKPEYADLFGGEPDNPFAE